MATPQPSDSGPVYVRLNPKLRSILAGGLLTPQLEQVYSSLSERAAEVVRLLEAALDHHVRFTWFRDPEPKSSLYYCHVEINLEGPAPSERPLSSLQKDCQPERESFWGPACTRPVLLLQPPEPSTDQQNLKGKGQPAPTGWGAKVRYFSSTRFATVGWSRDEVVQTAVLYTLGGVMYQEELPAWDMSAKVLYQKRDLVKPHMLHSQPLNITRDDARALAALLDLVWEQPPQAVRTP